MKAYQSPALRRILEDAKAREELRDALQGKLWEASEEPATVPHGLAVRLSPQRSAVTVSTSSGEQYYVTVIPTK